MTTRKNIMCTLLLGNGLRLIDFEDGSAELWKNDELIGESVDERWTMRRIERAAQTAKSTRAPVGANSRTHNSAGS